MDQLRTGIIGIGGYGKSVLAELAKNDSFKVLAIADRDRELAKSFAQQCAAAPYDDYRSLIVQEKLDVLFLALPSHLCGECIQLAAKAEMHLFKEAPLGRSLPEATQWTELMEKAGRKFYIGAQKRFAPGYLQAHQAIQSGRIGQVYLAGAEMFIKFKGQFDWRADPVLAGGGVLLESAYHMVDQLVWNLGLPQRIYCLNTNQAGKRLLPPSRTEDTAVLTINFPNGAIGNLICGWMSGPAAERIVFYGTEGAIEAGENLFRLLDADGNVINEEIYDIDEAWLIAQQIRQFAGAIFDDEIRPVSTAKEHLINIAVVESAYLSAKTQLPETLKVYGSLFEFE